MCDKISTWGKCEHCCPRSFAFKKMLPKEIEYESCYWGQIISLKQGALSCGNLVAHATMAGEGAGSCAPKCGSGATFSLWGRGTGNTKTNKEMHSFSLAPFWVKKRIPGKQHTVLSDKSLMVTYLGASSTSIHTCL